MRNDMIKIVVRALSALIFLSLGTQVYAGIQDGVDAYNKKNYSAALSEFQPLADKGDPVAQFHLGQMFEEGLGVKQDFVQAVDWYTKAAEQGNALAQFKLGLSYAKSQGVPVDVILAYKWFSLAAAAGDIKAQIYAEELEKGLTFQQLTAARTQALIWKSRHNG